MDGMQTRSEAESTVREAVEIEAIMQAFFKSGRLSELHAIAAAISELRRSKEYVDLVQHVSRAKPGRGRSVSIDCIRKSVAAAANMINDASAYVEEIR